MREKNRITLRKAIRQMPGYLPAQEVWQRIEEDLQREAHKGNPLREAIRELPEYQPGDEVWDRIESSLQRRGASPEGETAPRPPATRYRLWVGAAATIALLMTAGWWTFQQRDPGASVSYTHHREARATFSVNWEADEAAFEKVVELFRTDPAARQHDRHAQLLKELEELNRAKAKLRQAVDRYGADPRIIQQLADIERERSAVLKRMAALI